MLPRRVGAVMAFACVFARAPDARAQSAAAPTQWYRITLSDGRIVYGQFVGGDAVSHFVHTPQGVYSIARAQVVATELVPTPAGAVYGMLDGRGSKTTAKTAVVPTSGRGFGGLVVTGSL